MARTRPSNTARRILLPSFIFALCALCAKRRTPAEGVWKGGDRLRCSLEGGPAARQIPSAASGGKELSRETPCRTRRSANSSGNRPKLEAGVFRQISATYGSWGTEHSQSVAFCIVPVREVDPVGTETRAVCWAVELDLYPGLRLLSVWNGLVRFRCLKVVFL